MTPPLERSCNYGSLAMMTSRGERANVTDAAMNKVVVVNIWIQFKTFRLQAEPVFLVSKVTSSLI